MKEFQKWVQVPPKGWNSWDNYGASVREGEVIRNANYLAKYLKKFGYEYIVVDIQWYEPTASSSQYHDFAPLVMDKYSRLMPDPKRFPSAKNGQGFKKLADYVHHLGLKFGIHMMRGIPRQAVYQNSKIKDSNCYARDIALNNICPWNSDMYGVDVTKAAGQKYYDSVMKLYASWGVDFIKCDDIAYSKSIDDSYKKEIISLRKAIDRTNRPMILSLSPGPSPVKNASFFLQKANMWRITDDFWDQWELLLEMFERANHWSPISRSGNWPDCDMLPVGYIGERSNDGARLTNFTHAEQRSMMTLWSIMQSPLMIGAELPKLDQWTFNLLTNPYFLELDNNGVEKEQIFRDDQLIVWVSKTKTHLFYAFFNIAEKEINVNLSDYNIMHSNYYLDIWNDEKIENAERLIIPSHDVRCLKVK